VDKTSLIRALAFVLGVTLLLAVGWGAFKAVSEARAEDQNRDMTITLDTDSSLVMVIDSLESKWNKRVNYRFSVNQDPLYLGRSIIGYTYNRAGYRELEEDTEFRLSATVIDANPFAIIKYQGRSNIVKVGAMIGDGYIVQRIEAKTVVLSKGGQSIYLQNKALPLPPDEAMPAVDDMQQSTDNADQY
jgi:hypothetical protein